MESIKALKKDDISKMIEQARIYREQNQLDLALRKLEDIISGISVKDDPSLHNRILNEIEITQGKGVLSSKPRGLAITLTNRCNIRCIMCSVWHAPWDIPEKTIKEIPKFFPYLERIFWQGGEVFLSAHFQGLFEKISAYPNIRQDINTNGLLIDRQWAKRLAQANASIIFSIDGVTKKTYEYIRRGAQFEDLLKSIDNLNEQMEQSRQSRDSTGKKCSTVINLVVMKSNYRELGQFVGFAKKFKFDRLQITPVDIGNQENIFGHRDKQALAYIDHVMPEILEQAKQYGVTVCNWLPTIENNLASEKGPNCEKMVQNDIYNAACGHQPPPNSLSCYWPWQFLFIDWAGAVRPQCFCKKKVGNVHNNTIEQIWNSDIMRIYRERLFSNSYQDWCESRCIAGDISKEALTID